MNKMVLLVSNDGDKLVPESELKDGDIIKEDGKFYEMQEWHHYPKDANGKVLLNQPPTVSLLKVITFA